MSIEAPKVIGYYVVETCRGSYHAAWINFDFGRVQVNVEDASQLDWSSITAYRRLADDDLRELLHGPQPSGVPDKPGSWRYVDEHLQPTIIEVIRNRFSDDPSLVLLQGSTPLPLSNFCGTWYGRVEMPGEK